MADINTTGKRIHELEPLNLLKNEAWMITSQDTLTRKFPARMLRAFINGDNDEPSTESYYSSDKITGMFDGAGDRMNEIEESIRITNVRIDDLTNTVLENYTTLDQRITKEVNTLNVRIDTEVKTIGDRITTLYNELKAADDALRARCTALETRCTTLETRCTTIEKSVADLDTKLTGWILYGNAAPTNSTLPAGRLYVQWF